MHSYNCNEINKSLCANVTSFHVQQNGSDSGSVSLEGDTNACECDHKSYQQCSPDYKRLITIQNRKLKGSLKDKLKIDGELRRLSWSEKTLEKALESHGTDIVRYLSSLIGDNSCKNVHHISSLLCSMTYLSFLTLLFSSFRSYHTH